MTLMRQGDYIARVTYDDAIESFFGEVINTSDVITFYGRSVEELRREMAASIEAHLEACRARGLEPSRPYSGKFNVRLDPDEHARVAAAASAAGKSMNAWIGDALAAAAGSSRTERAPVFGELCDIPLLDEQFPLEDGDASRKPSRGSN